MPEGNAPFCGGSGPTWNDAMMAREILRRQADNPNYAPAPSGAVHRRILRAMVYLTLAVLITYYTLSRPGFSGGSVVPPRRVPGWCSDSSARSRARRVGPARSRRAGVGG